MKQPTHFIEVWKYEGEPLEQGDLWPIAFIGDIKPTVKGKIMFVWKIYPK